MKELLELLKDYHAAFGGSPPKKISFFSFPKTVAFVTRFQAVFVKFWEATYPKSIGKIAIVDKKIELFGKRTIECDVLRVARRGFDCAPFDLDTESQVIVEALKGLFVKAFHYYFLTYANGVEIDNEEASFKSLCSVDIFDECKNSSQNYIHTKRVDHIREIIEEGTRCCLVAGNSASGKTVSVIQALWRYQQDGANVFWFDAININVDIGNIIYSIGDDQSRKTLIVIDNAQARPVEVLGWMPILYSYLKQKGYDYCIVVLTWNNSREILKKQAERLFESVREISCNGQEQIEDILAQKNCCQYKEAILQNSKEDVLVAKSILDYMEANDNQAPTSLQLSERIYNQTIKGEQIEEESVKCLYYIAALGEFEIHVKKSFMEAVSAQGIEWLISKDIVRLYRDNNDSFVYLGHRSKANKIVNYIQAKNIEKTWVLPPEEIAVSYLKEGGQAQIYGMLERLDAEVLSGGTVFSNLWKAFSKVKSHLCYAVVEDSSWGSNMASMIFSAEALSEITRFDNSAFPAREKQAQEIRSRWAPNSDRTGLQFIGQDECEASGHTYHMTSEIVDFIVSISRTMKEEEEYIVYKEESKEKNIDFFRFHDNWLLGLLLGFEGMASDHTAMRLKGEYAECAQRMQLPSGAFYPERVSWVTARVLLGLAQCGYTFDNSRMVKDACSWLIDQWQDSIQTDGIDFPVGGWRSGTGSWNSDIQITLMNIVALNSVKFPFLRYQNNSMQIRETIDYIVSNAKSLAEALPNKLDIVWILAVLQSENEDLLQLGDAIDALSKKTIDQWGQANRTSDEKEDESSDIAFMAEELLNIMWKLVNQNIHKLLHGLDKGGYSLIESPKRIFISYRRKEGGGALFAESIYKFLNEKYRGEVFYDIVSLKHLCTEFEPEIESAIKKAVFVIVLATDHAFDRCSRKGYNLAKDVFLREIECAFANEKCNIIVVYNQDIELPETLRVKNPKCYELAEKLSKQNAVFFKPGTENAQEEMNESILDKIKNKKIL